MSQVCGVHLHHHVDAAAGAEMAVFVTRTSYQVGRPWMLDGNTLRGLTGTPWRRIERANSSWRWPNLNVDVGEADDEVVYAADRALDGHDDPA